MRKCLKSDSYPLNAVVLSQSLIAATYTFPTCHSLKNPCTRNSLVPSLWRMGGEGGLTGRRLMLKKAGCKTGAQDSLNCPAAFSIDSHLSGDKPFAWILPFVISGAFQGPAGFFFSHSRLTPFFRHIDLSFL